MPVPSNVPPNSIAQSTSFIVSIIPDIPLVLTSALSISSPVSIDVVVHNSFTTATTEPQSAEICAKICGCPTIKHIKPMMVLIPNVTSTFTRITMSAQVITGASSIHGEMWKVASSWTSISLVSIASLTSARAPIIANTISAIMSDGSVVIIRYFT